MRCHALKMADESWNPPIEFSRVDVTTASSRSCFLIIVAVHKSRTKSGAKGSEVDSRLASQSMAFDSAASSAAIASRRLFHTGIATF